MLDIRMEPALRKLSLYWLGLIVLTASGCVPSPPGSEFQQIAAYTPYWYIDDETDSVIEVKNNLQSELSLLPMLTLSTGKSVALASITVALLATKRLSLRSQRELRLYGKTGVGMWADGTRSNSLLSQARFLLIYPRG